MANYLFFFFFFFLPNCKQHGFSLELPHQFASSYYDTYSLDKSKNYFVNSVTYTVYASSASRYSGRVNLCPVRYIILKLLSNYTQIIVHLSSAKKNKSINCYISLLNQYLKHKRDSFVILKTLTQSPEVKKQMLGY